MKRIALFLTAAGLSLAQIVPNRYQVELTGEPAAAVSAAKRQRFSAADRDVQAQHLQMENQHLVAERAIRGLGGSVHHHFYAVANALDATLSAAAAARLAGMPGVRSVTPVVRTHILMDQALMLHRVTQAWQLLSGGSATAGAGIKIGILDTGIDAAHPAFQNFSGTPPQGFPIASSPALPADTNNKIIVARV